MKSLFYEAARYLGYRNAVPDETVGRMIHECLDEVGENSHFRISSAQFSLSHNGDTVNIGSLQVGSKTLAFHLKKCHSAHLLCATLGPLIDRLLLKYSVSDIAKCSVLQACASAYLEHLLDEYCRELALREVEKGNRLCTRYSAGYGDFSLSHNKDIISLCKADRIGIGTTCAYALTPSKSVTAVIGIYKE